MIAKNKLVHGVGINDADYYVRREVTEGGNKVIWKCPFYTRWLNMLTRCYYENYQKKYPSYKGCFVCEGWLRFSNFRAWMVQQDWEGKELDKDILIRGNKVYSPQRCVFVERMVNGFILENGRSRGDWPIGVSWNKSMNAFSSKVNNPHNQEAGEFRIFPLSTRSSSNLVGKKVGTS